MLSVNLTPCCIVTETRDAGVLLDALVPQDLQR
jgi:hypothetical protein